jgi:hypothetical protein
MRSLLIIDQTLQKILNDYLLLPGAEGLVPLNPTRLPSYISGVILSQDLNLATDLAGAPLNNLRVAGTYLTTPHNMTHGHEIFKKYYSFFICLIYFKWVLLCIKTN